MPRQAMGCEEKSHNSESISMCRVHQRHDKVQISGSVPHPQGGLWLIHTLSIFGGLQPVAGGSK